MLESKKVVFLSRKFEPIVNQFVITEVDALLHGHYPDCKLMVTYL